ncbi:MAG TPA: hypothetical protein DCX89_05435 [Saprospirales bacterium]|nr:hypothetical protein [Saprospirales bacterium]HAY71313.1 hypothetical protein [Saprospirales bacterium]
MEKTDYGFADNCELLLKEQMMQFPGLSNKDMCLKSLEKVCFPAFSNFSIKLVLFFMLKTQCFMKAYLIK